MTWERRSQEQAWYCKRAGRSWLSRHGNILFVQQEVARKALVVFGTIRPQQTFLFEKREVAGFRNLDNIDVVNSRLRFLEDSGDYSLGGTPGQFHLDAVGFFEDIGDLLGDLKSHGRVPDHLSFFLGLFE